MRLQKLSSQVQKTRILENILDNTADEINCYCFNLFDPEMALDSKDDKYLFYSKKYDEQFGHIILKNTKNKKVKVTYLTNDGLTGYYKHLDDKEFVGILNKKIAPDEAVSKQISPLKNEMWNSITAKYNIKCLSLKEYKKTEKITYLSFAKVHERILEKRFDNKVVIMADMVASLIHLFEKKKDYPIFLLDQETANSLISGFISLTEKNPDEQGKITIQKAMEAA
jgi:hypothetical protein